MELRKRSLIKEHQINKNKLKKRRKGESKQISRIEDLSCELWFELFAYFDCESLVKTFSQLNSNIESFLHDFRLPIHLNILCSNLLIPLPLNQNQIVSIHIDYSNINKNQIIDISLFIRLRSLSLLNINDEQLRKLPLIKTLDQISIQSKCARFVTQIILTYFPYVRRMRLNSMHKQFIVKHFQNDIIDNRIENLILDGKIKLAKLFRLWSFVPNLRCLSVINGGVQQCDYWMDENIISTKKFPSNLSFLHIHICDDDLSFSNLERLIPASLQYLKVSGSMADDDLDDYLTSINWIKLMSRCSTKLRRIKFDLSSYCDSSDSSGLQRTLFKFRKNSFFRNTIIQSKNYFITIKGYIEPDEQIKDLYNI